MGGICYSDRSYLVGLQLLRNRTCLVASLYDLDILGMFCWRRGLCRRTGPDLSPVFLRGSLVTLILRSEINDYAIF